MTAFDDPQAFVNRVREQAADAERSGDIPRLLQLVNEQPHDQPLQLEEPSRQELNLLLDLLHRQRTSTLLLEACLFRTESRGGHYRSDAPAPLPQWRRHSRQVRGMPIHTRQVSQ